MLGQILVEGAARAAQMVPLLFALNSAAPASAQLPRASNPPQAFETAVDEAPSLTLTEHHVDVQIRGDKAHVRSLLTYRNESRDPVSASFAFPFPTLLEQGERWRALGEESVDASDGCGGDLDPSDAEYLEAGEDLPPRVDIGAVTVAPGEQIRIETHRSVDLTPHAGGLRLALPLPVDRSAPYAPQFTADVSVDGEPAVTRLVSSTHGGAPSGLGSSQARLSVPAGRAYSGTQFVVDIGFGTASATMASWGGEAHAR